MPVKLDRSIKLSERLDTSQKQNQQDKDLSGKTANLLEILLRPEQNDAQIPGELLKEQRRKKKKGQRPGGLH